MKRYNKQLGIAIALLLALAALYYGGITRYLSLDYIKSHQLAIEQFIALHKGTAAVIYVTLYASMVFFMISLTMALTLVAGFFFDILPATLLSILGGLIGGTLSLFTIRYLLSGWLTAKYHHAVETFKQKFKQHGASYLLSLQFFPLTPLGLINTMAGLSDVSLITFLWTTALGIAPATLLCAFAGRQFATMTSFKAILSPSVLLALAALSFFALLPTIMRLTKKNF